MTVLPRHPLPPLEGVRVLTRLHLVAQGELIRGSYALLEPLQRLTAALPPTCG